MYLDNYEIQKNCTNLNVLFGAVDCRITIVVGIFVSFKIRDMGFEIWYNHLLVSEGVDSCSIKNLARGVCLDSIFKRKDG